MLSQDAVTASPDRDDLTIPASPRTNFLRSVAQPRATIGRPIRQLGSGPGAVSMLCDLFVRPPLHGSGCGRAMLAWLWPGDGRRMTFSSLHAGLKPEDGQALVCLPAPHPAVRALLASGWRVEESDLFMATEPDLLDSRRSVPSPALA